MNWEAISAIGEIVGAAAVVATLGYLAFQIRQSNSINASVIRQSFYDYTSRQMLQGVESSEFNELLARAVMTDDDLSMTTTGKCAGHYFDRFGYCRGRNWQGSGNSSKPAAFSMMASYVNVNYCVMRRKNTFVNLKQKIFSFANRIRKIRASDTDIAFFSWIQAASAAEGS